MAHFILVFSYVGHFSCVIFFMMCSVSLSFPAYLVLSCLVRETKDYVIFSYFRNLVAKSDQKPKTKYGMNETSVSVVRVLCYVFVDCLLCCKVIHVLTLIGPYKYLVRIVCYHLEGFWGSIIKIVHFFAKIGLIFQFCAWKGHTYLFGKNVKNP